MKPIKVDPCSLVSLESEVFLIAGLMAWVAAPFPATAHAGETLARVQSNGVVRCGVSEGIAGFSIGRR